MHAGKCSLLSATFNETTLPIAEGMSYRERGWKLGFSFWLATCNRYQKDA